jgi:hypothetical protein
MKRAWRDTVEAEELLTGERVRFAFCANRGKSGNNTHASAHVVMETPVSDELLDRLKRRWREKWGKWQRSSAGDKATVYWANNAVQKNAEIVHWQAPIWDDGAPGDGGLEIRMVHRRPTKEAQEGAVWLAQNDVPLPYKPLRNLSTTLRHSISLFSEPFLLSLMSRVG